MTNPTTLAHLPPAERFDVVVIGGGQAGLAAGYHLARRGLRFVILDAGDRVGHAWRDRWDSLRVFTPAHFDALPGLPFPAPRNAFPSKDAVADYLEAYAARFQLPIRTGLHVDALAIADDGRAGYVVRAGERRFETDQVVVATGAHDRPYVPEFAHDLDPSIRQFHASAYRGPTQLQEGDVLIVGASNSGAEIALDVADHHRTLLAGRDVGEIPIDAYGRFAPIIDAVIIFAAQHILTLGNPIGRRAAEGREHGEPVERARSGKQRAAGVERVIGRVVGARDGLPLLEDGRTFAVANVIWATGYRQDFSWIKLPVVGDDGWPLHRRGVVPSAPGLYFLGLPFLWSMSSALIGGVGRDAAYIVDTIALRATSASSRLTGDMQSLTTAT